jgi:branched-chain amino acid transport system substrate-binding protein
MTRRNRLSRRLTSGVVAGMLAAGGLAGCGSSSSTSSPTTSGSSGPAAGPTVSAASVATFTAYTGGHAGEATGTPIDIGILNSQGGGDAFPEYTTELKSAVGLINNQLGGAAGHPIDIKTCFIADQDSQGQSCAQQFLSDPKMLAIMQGAIDIGSDTFHATIAGKIPVVGALPNALTDAMAKNAFYLAGGQFGATSFVTYAKQYLHAKSISLLVASGLPVAEQAAELLTSAFKGVGISVKEGTYSPTATDYLSSIVASGAQTSSAFLPLIVTPGQCLALATDLKQVKIAGPVLSFSDCLGSAVKSGLGDYPKWTYLTPTVNALAPAPDPADAKQLAAFDNWFAPLKADVPDPPSAVLSLLVALTLDKTLNQAGPSATRTSLAAKLQALTGPLFLGAPTVKFGASPVTPAIGASAGTFTTYEGGGRWTNPTHGQWVAGPVPHGAP